MKTVQFFQALNIQWRVKDLVRTSKTEGVSALLAKYRDDSNCRPFDWIARENISTLEKASFIYAALN